MPKIISKLNTKSQEFLANALHMQEQVDDLKDKIATIKKKGKISYIIPKILLVRFLTKSTDL